VTDASTELLLDLYENAPCGFHSLDMAGLFVRMNQTELNWLGYRREEIVGRLKAPDILTPESRDLFAENFARFKAEGMLRDLEADFLRKDGSILSTLISATALRDESGNIVMSRLVVYDLTEKRRSEQEGRNDEARYRLLFETSMDGILLTAPDGKVLDANASACSMFGRTREQILSAGREDLIDVSDPALPGFIAERNRTGKVHAELRARRLDGTWFPIQTSSAIFRDARGHSVTCIIFHDISRRKSTETERTLLIAKLQEALAEVKVLSGLLSICSYCKKIRDENNQWESLEVYISDRSAAEFTHRVCPDCFQRLRPKPSAR
jgi:PAS domain S-box-containing protein